MNNKDDDIKNRTEVIRCKLIQIPYKFCMWFLYIYFSRLCHKISFPYFLIFPPSDSKLNKPYLYYQEYLKKRQFIDYLNRGYFLSIEWIHYYNFAKKDYQLKTKE